MESVGFENPDLMKKLEAAANEAMEQIRNCEVQEEHWHRQKIELQKNLNETLANIQKQFGVEKPPRRQQAKLPEIIKTYLEAHGPSRTKDIYAYLISQGVKTKPNVALGRMKKGKILVQPERGVYKLA